MKIPYKYDSAKAEYENGVRKKGFWIGFKEAEKEAPINALINALDA